MRAGTVLAALTVVVLGFCSAPPAVAAEAGGARTLSAFTGTDVYGSVGACSLWSSAAGPYGMKCSGGGRYRSFRDVLGGAPVPTCWLLPPGAEGNLTPKDTQPFATTVRPVRLSAPSSAPSGTVPSEPGPTGTPTAVPDGTSAPAPVAPAPATSGPATPAPATPGATTPTLVPTQEPPPAPEPVPTETTPVERPEEFLQVCLSSPPNPVTLAPTWDMRFDVTPDAEWLRSDPRRPPFWFELTAGQRAWLTRAEYWGNIDEGTLLTSPSRTPRIGQTVAFSVEGEFGRPVGEGGAVMRGELTALEVTTGEPGRPVVRCRGGGRELAAGDTDRTGPDVCSFVFRRTSAGQDGQVPDTYAVSATEVWSIRASADGGATWTQVREVRREVRLNLRVTEVQTLVVPLNP